MKKLMISLLLVMSTQGWAQCLVVAGTVETPGAVGMAVTYDNVFGNQGPVTAFAEANLKASNNYNGKKTPSYGITVGPKFWDAVYLGVNLQEEYGPNVAAVIGGEVKLFKKKLVIGLQAKSGRPVEGTNMSTFGTPELRASIGWRIDLKKKNKNKKKANLKKERS